MSSHAESIIRETMAAEIDRNALDKREAEMTARRPTSSH
jgi:hypothetical protein